MRGFSLVEIAIVLTILGILLQAAVMPLSTLQDTRRERAVNAELVQVRDALIARLVSDGTLPCPLADDRRAASNGVDDSAAPCRVWRGGLPAVTLALAGSMDTDGALLDPWGRRYRYAVSEADSQNAGQRGSPDWTTPGETQAVGIAALAGTLSVCAEPARRCPLRAVRANDLVFVVLSHGADASVAGWQAGNHRDTGSFVLAPRSQVAERAFDDAMAWGSRSELVWWLLRADRLP